MILTIYIAFIVILHSTSNRWQCNINNNIMFYWTYFLFNFLYPVCKTNFPIFHYFSTLQLLFKYNFVRIIYFCEIQVMFFALYYSILFTHIAQFSSQTTTNCFLSSKIQLAKCSKVHASLCHHRLKQICQDKKKEISDSDFLAFYMSHYIRQQYYNIKLDHRMLIKKHFQSS